MGPNESRSRVDLLVDGVLPGMTSESFQKQVFVRGDLIVMTRSRWLWAGPTDSDIAFADLSVGDTAIVLGGGDFILGAPPPNDTLSVTQLQLLTRFGIGWVVVPATAPSRRS